MYEIINKNDGTINVLKNNKELFTRIMHQDNTSIIFIPEGEKPNIILITEDLENMQTATFYDSNGKYIAGVGFNPNGFLNSLGEKPVYVIEQDSPEFEELLQENNEVGFFELIIEEEIFAIYLKNKHTHFIPSEAQIYKLKTAKKDTDNFFAYSYYGDLVTKTKLNTEQEVDQLLDEILEYDSELVQ